MEIIVNKKSYKAIKQLGSMAYLDFLELRDRIIKKDTENVMYTKQDFVDMSNCIVEMYGNQFTVDELLESVTPATIIIRFGSFDKDIVEDVDKKMDKMKINFTKH